MNPKDTKDPWMRLTRAARTVTDDRDAAVPHGFATRVAAHAFVADCTGSLFERYALRALGFAGLLAVLSVAVNYAELTRTPTAAATVPAMAEDDDLADSPVTLLITVD